MKAVGEVEGGVTGGGVNGVVVGELSVREKGGPGGLLEVDEDTKELFEGLVKAFGLTIGLGMESGGHGGLDVAEGEKTFPEVGGKEGIAVRDNLKGKTMEADDGGKEEVGKLGGRDSTGTRDEVG